MGRKKKKVVSTLTPEEWSDVFAEVPRETFAGSRDLAMCMLMYRCGLRYGECKFLRFADVNVDTGRITTPIEGKSADRIVMLPESERVRDIMLAWEKHRSGNPCSAESEYYFTTASGAMVGSGNFRNALAARAIAAGITRTRVSPHMMRHSFATQMLCEPDVTIGDVSTMLGHSSISVTAVYIHAIEGRAHRLMRSRKID